MKKLHEEETPEGTTRLQSPIEALTQCVEAGAEVAVVGVFKSKVKRTVAAPEFMGRVKVTQQIRVLYDNYTNCPAICKSFVFQNHTKKVSSNSNLSLSIFDTNFAIYHFFT
ncbi:uncharacterized protein PITG_13707 [Phytophthora infestans T30-4]|uniref:Uncharacterized protein n=1 Tax=Phytophthora infestans (strain T30-4) TaxID=403677 RepID=D0NML2_PHYIT|nr:uncharacterized protein PITG_13707 [Phytophthora infestans T30-4]EEY61769.1 hypothetical protein PITG_13707 [Phytophthora infestans T30-4]|eukprot:XP_002899409.1 hypothetical protein PITG_13707 [Phytophthora infestans T30-4]